MKICLILAASLFLAGCAVTPAPTFPEDLKDYYVTLVNEEPIPKEIEARIVNLEEITLEGADVSCLHFEVVEKHPVKLKYISEVGLKRCHMVGGFVPRDTQHLFNWVDDMWDWAETRKKCFK